MSYHTFICIHNYSFTIHRWQNQLFCKISFFPSTGGYSIYCVLKIGTTQLFAGRVISVSFCSIFFLSLFHFVINKPCKALLRRLERISYQYRWHSMTDCSWSKMAVMRTHFHGHKVEKHLFALILMNGSRCKQRSCSIFLSINDF